MQVDSNTELVLIIKNKKVNESESIAGNSDVTFLKSMFTLDHSV